GPYTPSAGDTLVTGDKTLKRGEASYGDEADFHTRYIALHAALYRYIGNLYARGVVCLPSSSSLLEAWELVPLIDAVDLYEPLWRDVRLGDICPLLFRQFPEYHNSWDYEVVYIHVGENKVLKHVVAQYHMQTKKITPAKLRQYIAEALALPISSSPKKTTVKAQ